MIELWGAPTNELSLSAVADAPVFQLQLPVDQNGQFIFT
jgi:hypothetical protein